MTKYSECVRNHSAKIDIEKNIQTSYINLLSKTEYGHKNCFVAMSLESIDEIECILPLDFLSEKKEGE